MLLSTRATGDPLSGASDAADLVRRLKLLAPQMPILWLKDRGAEPPDRRRIAPTAWWRGRPCGGSPIGPAGPSSKPRRRRCACSSRRWTHPEASPVQPLVARPAAGATRGGASLQQLERVSARLRDPATRGEVLTLVLEFAAEIFSRVAIFMLRDDVIVGMAQAGLRARGRPRRRRAAGAVHARERLGVAARRDRDRRSACAPRLRTPGDHRLAAMLGSGIPKQAYVAPIDSGGRVAALLYADDLPQAKPLADTTALEIVLHEAGLALDRALLERALAQVD